MPGESAPDYVRNANPNDVVRPPLGRHVPGWVERVSDMRVAKSRWHRQELRRGVQRRVVAALAADPGGVTPGRLRLLADEMENVG